MGQPGCPDEKEAIFRGALAVMSVCAKPKLQESTPLYSLSAAHKRTFRARLTASAIGRPG